MRGRNVLSKEAQLLVLHFYYALSRRTLLTDPSEPIYAQKQTYNLLGILRDKISNIVKTFTDSIQSTNAEADKPSSIIAANPRSNQAKIQRRIPDTNHS